MDTVAATAPRGKSSRNSPKISDASEQGDPASLVSSSQIKAYYRALFGGVEDHGWIVIAATPRDAKPGERRREFSRFFRYTGSASIPDLVPLIEECAKRAERTGATLAPIPALFRRAGDDDFVKAAEANLALANVLVAELDEEPDEGERLLREAFGSPSLIVHSGGLYHPDDGEPQAKRHLYWQTEPAESSSELARLKHARRLAVAIAGKTASGKNRADPSAGSPVHPLRVPGSVHMKGEPQLCTVEVLSSAPRKLAALIARAEKVRPDCKGEPKALGARVLDDTTAELVENVLRGERLHDSGNALAMRLMNRALSPGETVPLLQALFRRSEAQHDRPGEWEERFHDLERAVDSAATKLAFDDIPLDGGSDDFGHVADGEQPADPQGRERGTDRHASTALLLSVLDEPEPPPPPPFFVKPWAPKGHVGLLAAPGGTGKTALALIFAAAVASGRPFYGFPILEPGSALVWLGEEKAGEAAYRLWQISKHLRTTGEALTGKLEVHARRDKPMTLCRYDRTKGRVVGTAAMRELRRQAEALRPKVVILDHALLVYGADQSDPTHVHQFVREGLGRLATDLDCFILILGHTPKRVPGKPTADYFGSQAWDAAARVRWLLEPIGEGKDKEHTSRELKLSVRKANFGGLGASVSLFISAAGIPVPIADADPDDLVAMKEDQRALREEIKVGLEAYRRDRVSTSMSTSSKTNLAAKMLIADRYVTGYAPADWSSLHLFLMELKKAGELQEVVVKREGGKNKFGWVLASPLPPLEPEAFEDEDGEE